MVVMFACARCARPNHLAVAYCEGCGLPLGKLEADAGAGRDALGVYEAPDPSDVDLDPLIRDLARKSGFPAEPFGHGWRVVVSLPMDRTQAVYLGPDGTDPEGRSVVSVISVCGPATDRDARTLLKLNARVIEGHFAVKTLRGEEYFVVARTIPSDALPGLDAPGLVRRIAVAADELEERLSRGRDLY